MTLKLDKGKSIAVIKKKQIIINHWNNYLMIEEI